MQKLNPDDVLQYVEQNISTFHAKRIAGLDNLKLDKVLRKKNPYLFKAKFLLTPEAIVKALADAFISSQEETIFGDWLEGLAIFINHKVYGGNKSLGKGIDLDFEKEGIRYIVAIKSGPNWGNSSQIAKMKSDFTSAKRTLLTSNSQLNIRAVNGCCYGRDKTPMKDEYHKYCGQKFWEFISGDSELYMKLIEPLGHKAKEQNEAFIIAYSRMITKFTREFIENYCLRDNTIDWEKLVQFNSGE